MIMQLNQNDYTVEAAAGGGFFAYYMNNLLCSAYGETPDEACENNSYILFWIPHLRDAGAD